MRPLLIAGPTASGKSALALDAAKGGGVVINADALQVYAGWRILTARPSVAEEAAAPHRLYGHVPMGADYSAGHWLRDLKTVLQDIEIAGQRPIIVGGTGLYFMALTEGLAEIPPVPPQIRAQADRIREAEGPEGFLRVLKREDPALLARIDRANPMRLQRGWEVWAATGRPLSDWQAETGPPLLDPDNCEKIVLTPPVDWLNDRIARRLDGMIAQGALEECAERMAAGWSPDRPSDRAIGAPELIAHLRGEITLSEALERATVATRQYAKRQRTWFRRRMADWTQTDPSA